MAAQRINTMACVYVCLTTSDNRTLFQCIFNTHNICICRLANSLSPIKNQMNKFRACLREDAGIGVEKGTEIERKRNAVNTRERDTKRNKNGQLNKNIKISTAQHKRDPDNSQYEIVPPSPPTHTYVQWYTNYYHIFTEQIYYTDFLSLPSTMLVGLFSFASISILFYAFVLLQMQYAVSSRNLRLVFATTMTAKWTSCWKLYCSLCGELSVNKHTCQVHFQVSNRDSTQSFSCGQIFFSGCMCDHDASMFMDTMPKSSNWSKIRSFTNQKFSLMQFSTRNFFGILRRKLNLVKGTTFFIYFISTFFELFLIFFVWRFWNFKELS